MKNELSSSAAGSELLYAALFDVLPGNCILLQKDVPRFTIVAATPQYLVDSGIKKEALIGKGVFEVFSSNPNDPADTGEQNLRTSLEHVLKHKEPHHLPVQRYDVVSENGTYNERYWRTTNTPFFDDRGEVAFIIHSAIEITDQVKANQLQERIRGMALAHSLFMQAPVPIQIYKGPNLILTLANEPTLAIWNKGPEIVGKPLLEALPEMQGQGYMELLLQVMETGVPFDLYNSPATFIVNGKEEVKYFDTVYQPYYEE
jgi:hypothetical protein